MKSIKLAFITIIFSLSAISCSSNDDEPEIPDDTFNNFVFSDINSYIGTWKIITIEKNGNPQMPNMWSDYSWEIKSDGTFIVMLQTSGTNEYTYTFTGTPKSGNFETYRKTDGTTTSISYTFEFDEETPRWLRVKATKIKTEYSVTLTDNYVYHIAKSDENKISKKE